MLADLDRLDIVALNALGREVSFLREDVAEIAYKLDGEDDYSYVTADTEDEEIDALAVSLCIRAPAQKLVPKQVAEAIKRVRDDIQLREEQKSDDSALPVAQRPGA